jgi:hypothetical protein
MVVAYARRVHDISHFISFVKQKISISCMAMDLSKHMCSLGAEIIQEHFLVVAT